MGLYIGIDPGASGGMACIGETGAVVVATKMPDTDMHILSWLRARSDPDSRAVIERVWSSPQMGVASAFKFGHNVGALKMALAAAGIPYDEATPQKWQKAMGCSTGRSGFKGGDKNITKRRAQALFPSLTVTHAIADALLLAEFCRRLHAPRRASKSKDLSGVFTDAIDLFAQGFADGHFNG